MRMRLWEKSSECSSILSKILFGPLQFCQETCFYRSFFFFFIVPTSETLEPTLKASSFHNQQMEMSRFLAGTDARGSFCVAQLVERNYLRSCSRTFTRVPILFLGWIEAWVFIILRSPIFLPARAAPAAYGSSQARGLLGAVAAGLHHSHSNRGSEPCLRPTPQLRAMLDP